MSPRKQKLAKFNRADMRGAVAALYIMFNEDRAAGRLESIHSYVSEGLFQVCFLFILLLMTSTSWTAFRQQTAPLTLVVLLSLILFSK